MTLQTIEQARAAYATQRVESVVRLGPVAGHYHSYARQFGALIHTNGLGQALAFARSKAGNDNDKARAWQHLYNHFSHWLTGTGEAAGTRTPKPLGATGDALQGITRGDVAAYMLATAEAMALAVWLKRLAEALVDTKDKATAVVGD